MVNVMYYNWQKINQLTRFNISVAIAQKCNNGSWKGKILDQESLLPQSIQGYAKSMLSIRKRRKRRIAFLSNNNILMSLCMCLNGF